MSFVDIACVFLFGFVCHPFFVVFIVVTQLLWSLNMVDADLAHPALSLHLQWAALAVIVLAVVLVSQCRPREKQLFPPAWSLFNGAFFEGQLRLEMPWWMQSVGGAALGILVALVDESEIMTLMFFSRETVEKMRQELGPRGAVPNLAHPHDGLLALFILHGWLWTLLAAGALGAWSGAAKLNRARPAFHID